MIGLRLMSLLAVVQLSIATMTPCAVAQVEPLVIELWTTETQPERQAEIGYLAHAFTALHQDVEIRVVGVSDTEMFERVTASATVGMMPDVIHAGADTIVALSAAGYLNQELAASIVDRIGRERFAVGALDMLGDVSENSIAGIPMHGWLQGIVYRADWFEEAGLPPPATWNDILHAARRIHDPAKGRYGILIGTEGGNYAQQTFTQLALGNNVRLFDPDGSLAFNSPETVETLAFIEELASFTPPGPNTPRARDYFLQGRLGMMFYSTFIMDDLAVPEIAADALTGENFPALDGAEFDPDLLSNTRTITLVGNARPASFGAISALGLPMVEDAARRDAQDRFVEFLFRPDVYISWLHMAPGGMLPVLPEFIGDQTLYNDLTGVLRNYGQERLAGIVRGMEKIQTLASFSHVRRADASTLLEANVIGEMVRRVVHEGLPPSEAARLAEEKMRLVLER